jgi:hypothetical protein
LGRGGWVRRPAAAYHISGLNNSPESSRKQDQVVSQMSKRNRIVVILFCAILAGSSAFADSNDIAKDIERAAKNRDFEAASRLVQSLDLFGSTKEATKDLVKVRDVCRRYPEIEKALVSRITASIDHSTNAEDLEHAKQEFEKISALGSRVFLNANLADPIRARLAGRAAQLILNDVIRADFSSNLAPYFAPDGTIPDAGVERRVFENSLAQAASQPGVVISAMNDRFLDYLKRTDSARAQAFGAIKPVPWERYTLQVSARTMVRRLLVRERGHACGTPRSGPACRPGCTSCVTPSGLT